MSTAIERFASVHNKELDAEMVELARMFLGQKVYCQGLHQDCCAIWLSLGDGCRTMIGYGLPEDALVQATEALNELHLQAMDGVESFVGSFSTRRYQG